MTIRDTIKQQLKNYPTILSIFIFLSVLGPGLITAMVDNDCAGILTYSLAGAQYGYNLIWTFIPSSSISFERAC